MVRMLKTLLNLLIRNFPSLKFSIGENAQQWKLLICLIIVGKPWKKTCILLKRNSINIHKVRNLLRRLDGTSIKHMVALRKMENTIINQVHFTNIIRHLYSNAIWKLYLAKTVKITEVLGWHYSINQHLRCHRHSKEREGW